MLKRQENPLSSSGRQINSTVSATPPPSGSYHAKAVGCMSGIFQLFSKYQNPNKRITFGRRQEKSKQAKVRRSSAAAVKEGNTEEQASDDTNRSLTCDIKVITRSPTLQPEIRKSKSDAAETEMKNPRTPPSSSLVARLMGLEDLQAASKNRSADEGYGDGGVAQKRRLLLQALEKCNDDLEALKRIIKAVQADDAHIRPSLEAADENSVHTGGEKAVSDETNIPASVAEELTRSLPTSLSISLNSLNSTAVAIRIPLSSAKKPGEDDEPTVKPLNKTTITESSLRMRRHGAANIDRQWCSRAMLKSVEEVCGDITRGEKRAIEGIGLVLQDHLCMDLIEELVRELRSYTLHSLPFEACKRRLCF